MRLRVHWFKGRRMLGIKDPMRFAHVHTIKAYGALLMGKFMHVGSGSN